MTEFEVNFYEIAYFYLSNVIDNELVVLRTYANKQNISAVNHIRTEAVVPLGYTMMQLH